MSFFCLQAQIEDGYKTVSTTCQEGLWDTTTQSKLRRYCYASKGKLRHCSTETAYPQAEKPSQCEGCGNVAGLAQISSDTINHRLRDPYHL